MLIRKEGNPEGLGQMSVSGMGMFKGDGAAVHRRCVFGCPKQDVAAGRRKRRAAEGWENPWKGG